MPPAQPKKKNYDIKEVEKYQLPKGTGNIKKVIIIEKPKKANEETP